MFYIVCIYTVRTQLERSEVMCEQLFLYCRIQPEQMLYDAERDLSAVTKFLVRQAIRNRFYWLFPGDYLFIMHAYYHHSLIRAKGEVSR